MPYNADLRCSYCKTELNMSWFYEHLSVVEMEIDFLTDKYYDERKKNDERWDEDSENKKSRLLTRTLFEEFLDRRFNEYVEGKIFDHKEQEFDDYDNVWDYLRDMALDYSKMNPEVVMNYTYDE